MTQMAAEWSIFMILCIYGLIEWIRNGIWTIADTKPTLRKNAIWSAVAGIAFLSIFWFATAARAGGNQKTGGARR